MVVLAGNGHSWKRGIAAQVGKMSSLTSRVILPEIPNLLNRFEATTEDADYVWIGT